MKKDKYVLHTVLFLATACTLTLSGAELRLGHSLSEIGWAGLKYGFLYAAAFLIFLTTHEMGHYLMARRYGIPASLPYYIPVYLPFPGFFNIGSFGAVIRLRGIPQTRQQFFDVGVAGPLAGFVVALGLLVVGFLTLPPAEPWVMGIHPEYAAWGPGIPDMATLKAHTGEVVAVGNNLLFAGMAWLLTDAAHLPPAFELMHNPLLFTGFLALFFTALNLLPVGQLDGGHVVYGLWGKAVAERVSRGAVLLLVMLGGVGLWDFLGEAAGGSMEWALGAFWCLLYASGLRYVLLRVLGPGRGGAVLGGTLALMALPAVLMALPFQIPSNPFWFLYGWMLTRFVGLGHPGAWSEAPLNPLRKALAWLAILIFLLCITPEPLRVL